MSKLGIAICKRVQESIYADISKIGVLVIDESSLFDAANEAELSFKQAVEYCNTLGVWII